MSGIERIARRGDPHAQARGGDGWGRLPVLSLATAPCLNLTLLCSLTLRLLALAHCAHHSPLMTVEGSASMICALLMRLTLLTSFR